MTQKEWSGLKQGDKIRFIGKWLPQHIGDIETIYVDSNGTQYIDGEKSLSPLSAYDKDDWELLFNEESGGAK